MLIIEHSRAPHNHTLFVPPERPYPVAVLHYVFGRDTAWLLKRFRKWRLSIFGWRFFFGCEATFAFFLWRKLEKKTKKNSIS